MTTPSAVGGAAIKPKAALLVLRRSSPLSRLSPLNRACTPGPAPCNSRCCGGGVRVSVNVCSPVRRVSARVGGPSGTMVICSRPEVCDQRQAAASASPSGSAASGRQRRRDGTAYFTMYPEGE